VNIRQKKQIIVNNKALKLPEPSVKSRKQRKNADTHRITERIEILEGAVTVIRTTKSGQFWSMSCWVKQEGKCYRKSLRTKNREEAVELAREEYFRLMGDIRVGNKIFSRKAEELVKDFIKYKTEQAHVQIITLGRVKTITTSLKWFLKFVGPKTSLDKIPKIKFEGYYVWRRKEASDVRKATLVNERALISSLYKWGIARGYFRHDQFPIFATLKKSQVERRDALDDREYRQIYSNYKGWIKSAANEKEAIERKFIRDFIAVSTNTGLRFGEMRKLKWKMVKIHLTKEKYDDNEPVVNVSIQVPEDTKTGARTAVGTRGDVFKRIKEYSKHTKPDDWIFVNNETGEPLAKKIYYKQWNSLMKKCGLLESNKKLSFYSLRHTYITFKIIAKADIFYLAKNAGTSVRMIETHYAHITTDEMMRELTKRIKREDADRVLLGEKG
jgi:integrase